METGTPPPGSARYGRRATIFALVVALLLGWMLTALVRGLSEPRAPVTERTDGRITRIERCPEVPSMPCQLLFCEKALQEAGVVFPRAYSMRTNHGVERLNEIEYVFKFEGREQPQFVACRLRGYEALWAGRISEDAYERSGRRPMIP